LNKPVSFCRYSMIGVLFAVGVTVVPHFGWMCLHPFPFQLAGLSVNPVLRHILKIAKSGS
jgi:hypothetical protein